MTLKDIPDVRPKTKNHPNSGGGSQPYTLINTLTIPNNTWNESNENTEEDLDCSRKSKSLTNTPINDRRNGSIGTKPVQSHRLRNSHSTTSCDKRHVRYLDGGPSSSNSAKQRRASYGNVYHNVKSEESIEMVDEFDPTGPLLASSRKSLDNEGDKNSKNSSNKMAKSTTNTSTIPQSGTLVLNEDEYAQYVQLSQNMVLQHQVKVKMPFPTGTVIYIRGREVILAIALFFFLALSLGLVVAITRDKLMEGSSAVSTEETLNLNTTAQITTQCDTLYCESPGLMRQMANFTYDPCQDFWHYSCDGWLKNNVIPQHKKSWDVSKVISYKVDQRLKTLFENTNSTTKETLPVQKAKLMYKQCMKPSNSTENLDTIIKDLGGWYVKGKTTNDRYGLDFKEGQDILKAVRWKYWTSVFFEVWVAPDDKMRDTMRIQFDQGGLNLGNRNEYFAGSHSSKKTLYKEYMQKFNFSGAQDNAVGATFEFEQKLSQLHLEDGTPERENPEENYNNVTVKYMMQIAPQIMWLEFLQSVFPSVTEDTTVLITSETYFANLSTLIQNTQFQVLKQYMLWSVVFKYAQELSPSIRKAADDFRRAIEGVGSVEDRWEHCVRIVGDWFGAAVGAMYVNKYVTQETIQLLKLMVEDMRRAFMDSLKNSKWMSTDTRENAIKKLNAMSHIIGYPSYLLNKTVLENLYKNFTIQANDPFFGSLLNGVKNEVHMMNTQLITHKFLQRPDVGPHEVSAFYTWSQNMILLQSGILQPPHYHQNEHRVVNYGAIGSIIGHEMVHGFDNMGGQYDEHGAAVPWWSDQSSKVYDARLQCLVDQYSKYSVNGVPINGQITLGENMADIEGLKLSFKAWKKYELSQGPSDIKPKQHSHDQLFFIAFAQNWCGKTVNTSTSALSFHAPAKIRVKGTLSNLEEFSKAFNCPAGSPYNPRNKCSVWD